MKEQWKKLDSDAKLLLNVEEGRPLPIKIELPISAFVSNKDDCCKRLVTILRVFVLLALLIILSWTATILYAYCYPASVIDFDNNAFVNSEPTFDNGDKIPRSKDELYESMKADKLASNNIDVTTDSAYKYFYHSVSTTEDSPDAPNTESLFVTEKYNFLNKPDSKEADLTNSLMTDKSDRLTESINELNKISKKWRELFDKIKTIEQLSEVRTDENKAISDEQVNEANEDKSKSSQEIDFIEKTVEQIIRNAIKIGESVENTDESNENKNDSTKIAETSSESSEDSQKQQEKVENEDEIVNVLLNLLNSITFDEQSSDEDNSSTKTSSPEVLNSTEELKISSNENMSNEKVNTVSVEETTNVNKETSEQDKTSEMPVNNVEPLAFATLMAKYLEPVVGQNNELLVWYYLNKNNPDFGNNDALKIFTAKLLYSTNIAEYQSDMNAVLSMLINGLFFRDLKMLVDGEMKNIEAETSVQKTIVDRILTKLNMNLLVEADDAVFLDTFSRMIEMNNRLEITQSNVNLESSEMKKIFMEPSSDSFVEDPAEADKQRLLVLKAIRKVASDDVIPVEDVKTDNDDLQKQDFVESQEKFLNVINAMKKIAVDDTSKSQELFKFNEESTTDTTKNIDKYTFDESIDEQEDTLPAENITPAFIPNLEEEEKSTEKQELIVIDENQQSKEMILENIPIEKSEESDDEVVKEFLRLIKSIQTEDEGNEENKNMNDYLEIYGDLYDY